MMIPIFVPNEAEINAQKALNQLHLISPAVQSYITELLSTHSSPGLAVTVVLQDPSEPTGFRHQLLGAGVARSSFPHVPVTPDTLFAIASNSKLFLALTTGLLISNNSLNLDWTTKLATLIPEWELADPIASREATILDLLVHRTGMPRHDFAGAPLDGGVPEMIANLRHLRPSAPFRSTYQYNNMMFETLSHLPKQLLNMSFESFVDEYIFKPAGMNVSTYSVADAESQSLPIMAEGHQYSFRDFYNEEPGKLRPTVPYFQRPGEERVWAGAGGILTSVRDMVPWLSTLLNGGVVPRTNVTLIPQKVLDRLETGVMVSAGKAAYPELSPKVYGPAQERYTYRGHEIIEHGGNNPGFKTQIARLPNLVGKIPLFPNATGLGIAVFSNDASGGIILESIKWRIVDDLLGLEKIDWYSRYLKEVDKYYSDKRRLALPRPKDPQPPPRPIPSLEDYSFSHPAYGLLEPCFVPPGAPGPRNNASISSFLPLGVAVPQKHIDPSDRATFCAAFIQQPATQLLLSNTPVSKVPTIIIPFHRTFATHLRLTHWSGPWFNVSVVWVNHNTEDSKEQRNRVLIGLDERFEVEWVTVNGEEGLAFRGGIWGMEGADAQAPEGAGKAGAEVWFAKA
ncbi:hypothetical protein C0991_008334 [Blastosporella zonata]|nr:hypothetical protein C0991_008334 [Blastosporella zonata]